VNYVDNSTPLGENIKRGAFFPFPFFTTAEFSYYFKWGGDNSILCGLYIEKDLDQKSRQVTVPQKVSAISLKSLKWVWNAIGSVYMARANGMGLPL
jgi:hypothetical protein